MTEETAQRHTSWADAEGNERAAPKLKPAPKWGRKLQRPPKPKPPLRRIELPARSPSLSERVIAALRERFGSYGHYPSQQHWEGLIAIAKAIEDMAEGRAKPEYSYSSLATGMGKSSVLLEAIRQMRADPAYAEVGIVVFASRLDQIERMIAEIGLSREEFTMQTGHANAELNQRGRGRFNKKGKWVSGHQDAPILFTTQAKLLAISNVHGHKDYESFWRFKDQPSAGLDEAIMPAEPLVVTPTDIRTLASQLDLFGRPQAAEAMRTLASELEEAALANEPPFHFPLELIDIWMKASEAENLFKPGATSSKLFRMIGHEVRLFRSPKLGSGDGTLITYRELLPKQLAPMLILDASGDLKVTYHAWRLGRGGLVRLPSPAKRYRKLTIWHWDSGAGKARYRDNADRGQLADAAVRAFFSISPNEKVLLVVRKPEKPYADLVAEIRRKIAAEGGDPGRLEAIAWGWHTASNAYADIKHVIVLGLLQYRPADYEAHWRAAAGTPADVYVGGKKVEALRKGEIAHHLFQAVGRGAVRKAVDGDVPPGCMLWVVFSTFGNMGMPQQVLRDCFPGATIKKWQPFGAQLRGGKLQDR